MTAAPKPLPVIFKWVCRIFGVIILLSLLVNELPRLAFATALVVKGLAAHKTSGAAVESLVIFYVVFLLFAALGIWFVRLGWRKQPPTESTPDASRPTPAQTALPPMPVVPAHGKNKRWACCNLLHLAPDAKRLWQFDAKGGSFVLGREQRVPHTDALPKKGVAKNWTSLWQPKLNIAWLPAENIFFRVLELPAANAEETFAMAELQLEKLSPLPVSQVVWTLQVLGTHTSEPKVDGTVESLQTVVAVIVERRVVEEFLGRLEKEGFLADRLEVPMLDQLASIAPKEDSTWLFPLTLGGQNAALVAWWCGGALRNLSFVTLIAAGDRAADLKSQLGLLAMAGEVEGWLTAPPKWHLVADPVNATEWESLLRTALNEPVTVTAPPSAGELAGLTAKRAAAEEKLNLLPTEFTARYHQQFVDRLWLRGLAYAGLAYVVFCVFYFAAVSIRGYQTRQVESAVAQISQDYTNAVQLKARYTVLQERQKLKYAALDCWQAVAQQMPPGIQLQRMSFVDGQKLTLGGTATSDLVNTLFDFDSAIRKASLNGQPVFDSEQGDHISPRFGPDGKGTWNMSLELLHAEKEAK